MLVRLERRRPPTPFLGRELDLQELQLIARRAFDEGRPHLVTVSAPAGTGKSRLVQEYIVQLQRDYPDLRVAAAQCVPYGQTLTFWPLRSLLSTLTGLDLSDREQLREALRALLDDQAADLVAMTVAPEEHLERRNRDQIFAAWRQLIERFAGQGALVLVFEDLHWAADSLLDLVEGLMQPRAGTRLIVISVARPELLDRRPSWGGGRRNYLHLALEPLPDRHVETIVTQLLEGRPPEQIRDLIVERAGGNPFFAGELVRSLIEQGALNRGDVVRGTAVALPETVHATILARLDLLGEDERTVIQAASVIGRLFFAPGIATLTGFDAGRIDRTLGSLADIDLIRVGSDTQEWVFTHILIREVAYQTLPRTRRAQDHVTFARYLESSEPDRLDHLSDLIALHYLEATRLGRGLAFGRNAEEDERIRRTAIEWLGRAARLGAAAGATREATRQLTEAIAIATPQEEMALQEQLGEVWSWGDEAIDAFERAVELWRQLGGDDTTGARLLGRSLVVYMRWQGSYTPQRRPSRETVERLSDEALTLARRSGDQRAMGIVLTARAHHPFFTGARSPEGLRRAEDEAQQAIAIFERLDDPNWLSGSLDAVNSIALESDGFQAALDASRRRLDFFDRLVDGFERTDALTMVALDSTVIGELREALEAARKARDLPAAGRISKARYHAISYVILAAAMLGEWDEVIATAREALQLWEAGGREWLGVPMRHFAEALQVARRRRLDVEVAELRSFLEQTVLKIASQDPRWPIVRVYVRAVVEGDPSLAAEGLDQLDSVPSATNTSERICSMLADARLSPVSAERLDALVAYADTHGARPLLAQLLRLRSIARGGDVSDVRRALEILQGLGMAPDGALTELELARLTNDRSLVEHARQTLTRLGDQVGLERAATA